eukprot:TRINITY_DN18977_c0_g1_i1.p1 TRINITY_DN18977_c0_g1~~TRINITY_DN18977_c0_g1_i1.p1  ORF type:complete len:310 (+),score=55.16 TRINITY_DN18977_c0_g1_i1:34-963(+)
MESIKRHLNFLRPAKNRNFFLGKQRATPSREFIDEIHAQWFAKFEFLEENNNYMEWLFPIFGSAGINPNTKALTAEEAETIRNSINCSIRFVKSYKLILNFFGMKLEDDLTGKVVRDEKIWQPRYCHMNTISVNVNKISRILKCMGQLGFERYQKSFVKHLQEEIEEHGLLGNLKDPLKNYWMVYLKGTEGGKLESVFFQHAQSETDVYRRYKQSEQEFMEANRTRLEDSYNEQLKKTDIKQLYAADNVNKSVESTSYFKWHYNSQEEENASRLQFLENLQKSRAEIEEKRQRARENLQNYVNREISVQ